MLQAGIAGLGDQLPGHSVPRYERHRPEQTLLYQIVDKHYPDFLEQLVAEGKFLPDHVRQEFTDYLKCGLLEHGFLRVRCESCHHEKLVAFSCKKRGFLNIHFHMLFLDGVYVSEDSGNIAFHCNKAPSVEQLTELLYTIS